MRSLDCYCEDYLSRRDACRAYAVNMRATVKRFTTFLRRPVTLDDLTPLNFGKFAEWLKLAANSPHTVNGRLRHLKSLWFAAADDKLIPEPPRKLKRLKTPAIAVEGWSVGELKRLIAAVPQAPEFWQPILKAILLLAYNTGLRRGDLLKLRRSQIVGGRLTHTQSKTGNLIYRDLWPDTLAAIGRLNGANDAIFPKICTRTLHRWLKRLAVAADVPVGGMKFLRRGSASEVERTHPGAAYLFLGHSAPGLFDRSYKVHRICGDSVPLPPRP